MTIGEKQSRACVQCGAEFEPGLRHPKQRTCGKICPGWYRARRDKALLVKRERYRNDPEHRRDLIQRSWIHGLKKRYGVSAEQYEEALSKQNGRCAVCGAGHFALSPLGYRRRLAIDHDHATGQMRGLLCHKCNMAVGYMDDNPDRADLIAAYLRRWAP